VFDYVLTEIKCIVNIKKTQNRNMTETETKTEVKCWRDKVTSWDALPEHCQEFLDAHHTKFRVTTGGLVHLTESIGVIVPYELAPLRVKKVIRKITPEGELPRSLFKTKMAYQSALCNLYVYGYLGDIDQTILERRRARAVAKKRWASEHPDKIKAYAVQGRKFQEKHKLKMTRV
jgi:hypothetical protein